MNCPFCQGPTTHFDYNRVDQDAERVKDDPNYKHYFEHRTCNKCQTPECSLELCYMVHKDPEKEPELINYCLKYDGYTAWVGVKYPMTEITHDWHTTTTNGTVKSTTMCYPVLMTQEYSAYLTPENFPRRLLTIKTFQ